MKRPAVRILVVGIAVAICPAQSAESQMAVETVASNHRAYVPSGPGRFPTVIAIPGCSGVSLNGPATDSGRPADEADRLFRRHYPRMAERLQAHGYATILVDYLTAEGVENACGREISHERVGEYIQASITLALKQPFADPERLFVVGWSHGGGGLLAWLQAQGSAEPMVAGVVGIYPECDTRGPWSTPIPVLLLLGTADDISLPERCDRIAGGLPSQANLLVERYQGGRHGFDLTEGPEMLELGGGFTVGRNDAAGRAAWRKVFWFLESPGAHSDKRILLTRVAVVGALQRRHDPQ